MKALTRIGGVVLVLIGASALFYAGSWLGFLGGIVTVGYGSNLLFGDGEEED